MIKTVTIMLACVGLSLGAWTVATSDRGPQNVLPNRPPALSPYPRTISAVGLVEAASRNIQVACAEAGVVNEIYVEVNDSVRAGNPILRLDTTVVAAELESAQAAVRLVEQKLERLESMPREEDVAPLRAVVERIKVELAYAERELQSFQQLEKTRAVSGSQVRDKAHAVDLAAASLEESQADLDRLLSGSWEKSISIARHEHEEASRVNIIRKRLARRTLRSPIDGVVLKRLIGAGEFISPEKGPAVVVGDISTLTVRAQVDEADGSFLRQGSKATAFISGQTLHAIKLRMLRIEPLCLPKQQLTRSDLELIDTRVIEVLFAIEAQDGSSPRLYPGQILDVFIEGVPDT